MAGRKEGVDEFLKYAIEHLEGRIALLDNKASINIAGQGVFVGVLAYILGSSLVGHVGPILRTTMWIVAAGILITVIPTIALLLRTIRPTKRFLGLRADLDHLGCKIHLMWPVGGEIPPQNEFKRAFDDGNDQIFRENYLDTLYCLLQLIKRKYHRYRYAALFGKIFVLWSGLGIFAVGLVKLVT